MQTGPFSRLEPLERAGGGLWVTITLRELSDTNRQMQLYKEGIEFAKEAL